MGSGPAGEVTYADVRERLARAAGAFAAVASSTADTARAVSDTRATPEAVAPPDE